MNRELARTMANPNDADSEAFDVPPSRLITIPNLLCIFRIVASFGLILLAIAERPTALLIWYLLIALSDWLDGKLARWMHQRSAFGARLDTVSDVTLYAALLFAGIWLLGDVLAAELPWILATVGSYAVCVVTSFVKFRSLPAHHTWAAKTSWLAMIVAVVALFAGWSTMPLRIAMVIVTLTNLESLSITLLLPQSRVDVPSVFHALRLRRTELSRSQDAVSGSS